MLQLFCHFLLSSLCKYVAAVNFMCEANYLI